MMSSKRQKFEYEILKYRNEGNWSKLKEATNSLSQKYGPSDGVVMLLEAEVQLRLYLEEHPHNLGNVSMARQGLTHLSVKLRDCAVSEVKDSIFDVVWESKILECILLYSQGKSKTCIDSLKTVDLNVNKNNSSCYQVRLAAEANSVKGLCLEQLNCEATHDVSVVDCYDRSSNLCFTYMSTYSETFNTLPPLGYALEQALQRSPLLHLKNGNVEYCINRLRRILISKHTSSIHQKVAQDLASVLLRGLCQENYAAPHSIQHGELSSSSQKKIKHERLGSASPSALFSISPLDKAFVPSDVSQESFLLLLLSETILNTDPILDMSSEHVEARNELLKNSRTLYNLLAITVTDSSLYGAYTKVIEPSLKYAYNEFHLWYQYALSLLSAGNFERAFQILNECSRICPEKPLPYLFCAKICLSQLEDFSAGLLFAKKALHAANNEIVKDPDTGDYLSVSHTCVGLAHSMLCHQDTPLEMLMTHRQNAILHFSEAHNIDPYDVRPLLFLALELALDGQIREAIESVKRALELQPSDLSCLHLLSLLLSALKQQQKALSVLGTAMELYPENINLLLAKTKLQLFMGENEDALATCNYLTNIFVAIQEVCTSHNLNADTMLKRLSSDRIGVTNHCVGNDMDNIDTTSVPGSTVMSRFERSFSDLELQSCGSRDLQGVSVVMADPSSICGYLWLLATEVYVSLHRYDEAGQCIQESSKIFQLSHEVLFAKGHLAHRMGRVHDAVMLYQTCITVNPRHHKAMFEWAEILVREGDLQFAKKLMEDVIRINPWSYKAWLSLGNVLQDTGDIEGATNCISKGIDIERTCPVIPFLTVTRVL